MIKILSLLMMLVAFSQAANETIKLNGDESVLLLQVIHERASRKNLNYYIWSNENIENTIADDTCKKLLKNDLVTGIKSARKDGDVSSISSVEVKVEMVKNGNELQKNIVVMFRGNGGDTDITYHYKIIGGDLKLIVENMVFLEILRATE